MILVTGGTGFVGNRLLRFLESNSYNKENIVLLTSHPICGYKCINHEGYTYGKEALEKYQFEAVIHLGATTPKGSQKERVRDYIENIRSTVHLIETLPNVPQKIIFASSVSVYNRDDAKVISEDSALTSTDMYGLSKIMCEEYLKEWCENHNVVCQILRIGAVYGPGEEKYAKIASYFFGQAMKQKDITIYSDGQEVRNMIYVDDLCACIYHMLIGENESCCINVVSSKGISVKELAEYVIRISKSSSRLLIMNNKMGRDDQFDATKMNQIFGQSIRETTYPIGLEHLYWHLRILDAETIYIDLDGTLLEDFNRHYACYRDIVLKYGGTIISKDEYCTDKRNKTKRTVLLEKSNFGGSYDDYLSEWLDRIEEKEYLELETLKLGVIEFLKWLNEQGKSVVLITMRRNRENLLWQLEKLQIKDFFSEIITGNPLVSKKKDLIINCDEKAAIVLGDTEGEMELAQKLGAPFIAITSGMRERKYLDADFYIEQLVEL